MSTFKIAGILMAVALLAGCKPASRTANAAQKAADALDRLANTADVESPAWRSQVEATVNELKQISADAAHDLEIVLARTNSKMHNGFRCDIKFLDALATNKMRQIAAKITGKTLPPSQPEICGFVPQQLDLNRSEKMITFDGYGFDEKDSNSKQLSLFRLTSEGKYVDVSDWLSLQGDFEGVISLDSKRRTLIREAGDKSLVLMWGGKQINGGVPLQPFQPQPKAFDIVGATLGKYVPPLTRGDADFSTDDDDGIAVRVELQVQLQLSASQPGLGFNDQVQGRVHMNAIEWKGDRPWGDQTTVDGWSNWETIYSAPPGQEIIKIVSQLQNGTDSFTAGGTEDAPRRRDGDGKLVSYYEYIADTVGPEAGTKTGVITHFKTISIQVAQRPE